MGVAGPGGGDDLLGQVHLLLVDGGVGVEHVADQAHDLHALAGILCRQGPQVGHLLDAGAAEGGPDVDHGDLIAGEHGVVHGLSCQGLGGEVCKNARRAVRGGPGVCAGLRLALAGLLGDFAAALVRAAGRQEQTQGQAGDEKFEGMVHSRSPLCPEGRKISPSIACNPSPVKGANPLTGGEFPCAFLADMIRITVSDSL